MAVQFHESSPVNLKERTRLRAFLPFLFSEEGKALSHLNVIFCSDEYLWGVNKQFLQHDYFTDIITFNLSAPDAVAVTAELYISVDRVKDNAGTHNTTFARELHRVIFHGCLHLCGFRDKSKKDIALMRTKEEEYLRSYLG